MKRFSLLAATLASGFFLAACGGEDPSAIEKTSMDPRESSASIDSDSTDPATSGASTLGSSSTGSVMDGYFTITAPDDWEVRDGRLGPRGIYSPVRIHSTVPARKRGDLAAGITNLVIKDKTAWDIAEEQHEIERLESDKVVDGLTRTTIDGLEAVVVSSTSPRVGQRRYIYFQDEYWRYYIRCGVWPGDPEETAAIWADLESMIASFRRTRLPSTP